MAVLYLQVTVKVVISLLLLLDTWVTLYLGSAQTVCTCSHKRNGPTRKCLHLVALLRHSPPGMCCLHKWVGLYKPNRLPMQVSWAPVSTNIPVSFAWSGLLFIFTFIEHGNLSLGYQLLLEVAKMQRCKLKKVYGAMYACSHKNRTGRVSQHHLQ